MDLNAILVCVDYSDLLNLTLPYNRHHFKEVVVVTTSWDLNTHRIVKDNDARLYVTDAFYANGADFNKWKALEEGLDALGRRGWLCIMDADVLWPKEVQLNLKPGNLYTPYRRMMEEIVLPLPSELLWGNYPLHPQQREFAGYTQLFWAHDTHLGDRTPWHETNWKHAGGADSFFQKKWPDIRKVRPGFEVLHLGEAGANWCGRATKVLGGEKPPEAEARTKMLRSYISQRRSGPNRFDHEKIG